MKEDEKEVVHAVVKWIATVREAYGNNAWLPHAADVSHSALLQRIMSGKAPLPHAPPRAFSYPWYDLYDKPTEDHFVVDVHVGHGAVVIINQAAWDLIETVEIDMHYVVKYGALPDIFDLKLKPYIAKVFQKSTKTMVEVPSEGWFIKKR
jgi:hypothetical protein